MVALSRTARRAGPLALLAAAVAVAALADARASYRQGLDALEREAWRTAARHLEAAIAERPEESVGTFRRYLPHYHLGLALFGLGDCPGAVAAFAESERQGAILKTQEFQTLRQRRAACREQQRTAAAARTDAALAGAVAVAERVAALRADPALRRFWRSGEPSRAARHDRAAERLRQANAAIQDPAADVARLEAAAAEAAEVRGLLAALADEAASWRLAGARRGLLDEAAELLAATAGPAAGSERLSELRSLTEQAAAALVTATEAGALPDTAAAGVAELESALELALDELRSAAAPPPAALRESAAAYLEGDHRRVIELLEAAELETARARAHACLLLAAARFSLAVAAADGGDALREQAATDARCSRALDPALAPARELFSPRFVEFFDSLPPTARRGADAGG